MNKFNVAAAIKIGDGGNGISLNEPLEYNTSSGLKGIVSSNPNDNDLIDIRFELQAQDNPQAMFLAESELLKLSNVLSWRYNVSTGSYKVVSLSRTQEERDGSGSRRISVDVMDFAMTADRVSMTLGLGRESLDRLKRVFEEEVDTERENVLMMWREAVSETSKQLQFILYYRVLEHVAKYLLGIDVEKYIIASEPSVETEPSTRRGKGVTRVSIYTHLRDNMHPNGGKSFPFQKLEQYLVPLANLARKAITEKYPDLMSS